MAKKKESQFDAAGWFVWLIVFGVLLVPAIWILWIHKPEDASWLFPIGMGVVLAALGSGFITWIVNTAIQWRHKKKRIQDRKKSKKQ